jgi:hypothetical protein
MNLGSIGVTGSSAANAAAPQADLVVGRRHAPAGLHHRLAGAVRPPGDGWSR